MDDQNRKFALKSVLDSELQIKKATGECALFPWGKVVYSSEFPDYIGGNMIFDFSPDRETDIEQALREAGALLGKSNVKRIRLFVVPEFLDKAALASLEEDLYLLDFGVVRKSDVYVWVKSKKAAGKADVTFTKLSDFGGDSLPQFEGEPGDPPAEIRRAIHLKRDSALEGYTTYIAAKGGEPMGRCAYFNAGVCGRLRSLWILPGMRRRGVGSSLAMHTVEMAREAENVVIGLITEKDNPARYMYTNLGFTPIGEVWTYEGAFLVK